MIEQPMKRIPILMAPEVAEVPRHVHDSNRLGGINRLHAGHLLHHRGADKHDVARELAQLLRDLHAVQEKQVIDGVELKPTHLPEARGQEHRIRTGSFAAGRVRVGEGPGIAGKYRMGARPTRRRRRQERRYAAESRSLTQCFTSGFATLATCLRFCPAREEAAAAGFAAEEAVATTARDEGMLRRRRPRSGLAE